MGDAAGGGGEGGRSGLCEWVVPLEWTVPTSNPLLAYGRFQIAPAWRYRFIGFAKWCTNSDILKHIKTHQNGPTRTSKGQQLALSSRANILNSGFARQNGGEGFAAGPGPFVSPAKWSLKRRLKCHGTRKFGSPSCGARRRCTYGDLTATQRRPARASCTRDPGNPRPRDPRTYAVPQQRQAHVRASEAGDEPPSPPARLPPSTVRPNAQANQDSPHP